MHAAASPDHTLASGQLQHDAALRAAARAIYEAVYPGEEWSPVGFEEAEKYGTVHYRNAVSAAQMARLQLMVDQGRQLVLAV